MTSPFRRHALLSLFAILPVLIGGMAQAQEAPRFDLRPFLKSSEPQVPVAKPLRGPSKLGMIMLGPETPMSVAPSGDGRELVLRYRARVPATIFDPLEKDPPGYVEYVSRGLDQVLIRFRDPVRTAMVLDSQGSVLEVFPGNALAAAAPGAAAPGGTPGPRLPFAAPGAVPIGQAAGQDRRLEIARQRLRYRSGDELAARQRLRELSAQRPEDTEAALALAEVEEGLGRGRRALSAIDRALLKKPENDYLRAGRRRLARQTAGQVGLTHDYQRVKNGDVQHITVLSTLVPFDDRFEFGFRGENRELKTSDARATDGGTRVFNDGRQRGELSVSYGHDNGGTSRAALLGGRHSLGLELSHTLHRALFRTTLTGTYNRPYWDLVAGIVDAGVYDGVRLDHEHSLGPRLTATASLGARRYGLDDDDDVMQTGTLSLSVRYGLPSELFDLSLGYALDGEYVHRRDVRLEGTANRFEPLPVTTREIHTLDVTVGYDPLDFLRFDMFAGLGWNRYGETGPLGGLSVTYNGLEPAEIGARLSYSEATSRGDSSSAFSAGGFVNWRF